MKTLWAPWRIGYIKKIHKQKKCLFCRVAKQKTDSANLVFLRSRHALAMLNLYPYNNGHALVAPLRHVAGLELLTTKELMDLLDCLKKTKRLLERTLKPEGFNIGINIGRVAGAGIEKHLHIHIVPRWSGDTNFMPTSGKTKVISQSLNSLWRELKKLCRP